MGCVMCPDEFDSKPIGCGYAMCKGKKLLRMRFRARRGGGMLDKCGFHGNHLVAIRLLLHACGKAFVGLGHRHWWAHIANQTDVYRAGPSSASSSTRDPQTQSHRGAPTCTGRFGRNASVCKFGQIIGSPPKWIVLDTGAALVCVVLRSHNANDKLPPVFIPPPPWPRPRMLLQLPHKEAFLWLRAFPALPPDDERSFVITWGETLSPVKWPDGAVRLSIAGVGGQLTPPPPPENISSA